MCSFVPKLACQWLASLLVRWEGPLTTQDVYRLRKSDWVMEGCFGSVQAAERASALPALERDMVREALAAEPVSVNA